MVWWLALPFTATLLCGGLFAGAVLQVDVTPAIVLLSAAWCALDSRKIRLQTYQSGISYGPLGLFVAISCLWLVGFPWYLIVRHRIRNGGGILKAKEPGVELPGPPPDLTCPRCGTRYPSPYYFPGSGTVCGTCQRGADPSPAQTAGSAH